MIAQSSGTKARNQEKLPFADCSCSKPIDEKPPAIRPGEEAAWLKTIFETKLVFMSLQGQEIERPKAAYQGKHDLLKVGHWFILSGTVSSRPISRQAGVEGGCDG